MKTCGEYQLVSIILCPAREGKQQEKKKVNKKITIAENLFNYHQVWMDLNSMQNNCTKSDCIYSDYDTY